MFGNRWLDDRVAESTAVLADHLGRSVDTRSPLIDAARTGLSDSALGGKHLRSRLVHVAAGHVEGPARDAAVTFGACVDLLHGAFLIHDDIIDNDVVRRGVPTVHAHVHRVTGNEHVGVSVGILAGDLGITGVFGLLAESPVSDSLVRAGIHRLTRSATVTIAGELLDVEHSADQSPDPSRIRLANTLKTADYTFGCPLYLGALAAGRDPESTTALARELGAAFQAADDLAGAEADAAGKRSTLASIQPLAGVAGEGHTHLDRARSFIDDAHLPEPVAEDLRGVADWIAALLKGVHP